MPELYNNPRTVNRFVVAAQAAWDTFKRKAAAGNEGGRVNAVPDYYRDVALFTIRQDRRAVINDAKRMSVADPRISSIMEVTASDATLGGFTIAMKNLETTADEIEAQSYQVMEGLKERMKANSRAEGWARRLIRDGDLFGQVMLNPATGEVIDVKVLEASLTHPNKDNRGEWREGPEKAYYQTDATSDVPVQYFAEWEIIHVKWGGDASDLYGQSQWRSARKAYHILDKAEEDLAIRRRVRTGLKLFHSIQGSWDDVIEYKKQNKETLDHPYDVTCDFFGNKGVVITPIQGDTETGSIGDILFFMDSLFVRGRFPKALLGYEANVAGDLLTQQVEQYYRYLNRISAKLEEFIRGAFTRALLFAGINDEAIQYTIEWGARTIESQDSKIARAHTLRQDGAISMETYHLIANLPGVDWATEKEKILAEQEDFDFPPFSFAMGRPFLPMSYAELSSLYPQLLGLPVPGAPPSGGGQSNEQQMMAAIERVLMNELQKRKNGAGRH